MKLTTIIAFLAANFMVANAASTMNQVVIDLSNNDDSLSSHNDAVFPDGPGLLNTDNSVDSYDVDGFSDNHANFFDTLADDPDELNELYSPNCFETYAARGGYYFLSFLFEKKCLLVSSKPSDLVGFERYTFNCCGPSTWTRINIADLEKLFSQGVLEGVRFQHTYFKDGERYFPLAKFSGNEEIPITAEEFFS